MGEIISLEKELKDAELERIKNQNYPNPFNEAVEEVEANYPNPFNAGRYEIRNDNFGNPVALKTYRLVA
tara:strand:+ start:5221 stop:5427 length:207 start_codon:yes stop_codon:yes gene_type:complete